jgi:hypothetical protein
MTTRKKRAKKSKPGMILPEHKAAARAGWMTRSELAAYDKELKKVKK